MDDAVYFGCIVLQNSKNDELGLETETSEMSLTLSEMEKEGGTSFSCFWKSLTFTSDTSECP